LDTRKADIYLHKGEKLLFSWCWLAINLARAVCEAFSKIWPAKIIQFTTELMFQVFVLVLLTWGYGYVALYDDPVAPLVDVYAFT
jgi:hypothetical protein